MKLSCNVIRDLLPLYYDGVSSNESGVLVEAHLTECEKCRAILNELRGEIEMPRKAPDDLAPLERIEKNVQQGKKKAWLRGAAAVLAVVLMVFAGVNVWWYIHEFSYYQQFAEGHEADWQATAATQKSYMWIDPQYQFVVATPGYLGTNGMVEVSMTLENSYRSAKIGKDVNVILHIKRDRYDVVLSITEQSTVSGQSQLRVTHSTERLTLDYDLNLVSGTQRTNQLLEEYRTQIMDVVEAAQTQWPFLTE